MTHEQKEAVKTICSRFNSDFVAIFNVQNEMGWSNHHVRRMINGEAEKFNIIGSPAFVADKAIEGTESISEIQISFYKLQMNGE